MKKLILLGILVYFTARFCNWATDGFTIARITSDLTYNPKWETTNCDLHHINQPFRYLSSGGQAYVFVSADDKYVLKLFKHHLRRVPSWMFWQRKKIEERKRKLERDFVSYKLAFEELQEETGLCYVHLNKTNHLKQTVTIIDKLGISHPIDLDAYEFILQKKGELVYPYIENLLKNGKTEEAKQAVSALLKLVIDRSKKGIYDEDAKIHRNFGFLDGKAISIDIGRFKRDERRKDPKVYTQDLQKITSRLKTDFPDLSGFIEQELEVRE